MCWNSGFRSPMRDWNCSGFPLCGVAVSKTRCFSGLRARALMRLYRWCWDFLVEDGLEQVCASSTTISSGEKWLNCLALFSALM